MYNRYIPQSDGTYRRDRRPEPVPPKPAPQPEPSAPHPPSHEPEPCPPPSAPGPEPRQHRREGPATVSAGSFLKQLLPKDFDTGDLLIVLLLLVMAGDCAEEQNTALLTLALYLFL